jgi:hypothetical protein
MGASKWPLAAIAVFTVAVTLVLVRRHSEVASLRRALAQQQANSAELARLQNENRRLAAAQPTEQQLEAVAADLLIADQLRSQIAVMHRRVELVSATPPTVRPKPTVLSLVGNSVAAELWQDAGRATPEAALQTALWAAANGDLDALADSMVFDAETRLQIGATFSRLPAVLQGELGTPEKMIALLTANDIPLGRASITRQNEVGKKITVQLIDTKGAMRTASLSLQAYAGQWRFKVPSSVVRKYSHQLGVP